MKKIFIQIIIAILAIFIITIPVVPSIAQSKGVTLESLNPFYSKTGGIKCLYSYKNEAVKNFEGCTTDTALLNRVEQLLYILAPAFAIIGIMLGGYKMMQDGYDSKGEGMKTIRGSIIGLIIVLSAYFIRNITYTLFNGTFTDDKVSISNTTVKVIIDILNTIAYQILIPIGSPIAVGFVIWGGYQLVTAGGNPKQIDAGVKTIKNAIIGFLVILFAAALVSISQNIMAGFFGTVSNIKP